MIVIGRGGHAIAVEGLALRQGWPSGRPEIMEYEAAANLPNGAAAIIGLGSSNLVLRVALFAELRRRLSMVSIVSGDAVTPRHPEIGDGTAIFPCTLGDDVTVGENVVIYSGCVVEHGSVVEDHAWLSPGVILCGNVTVKPRVFIGAGAIILPGVTLYDGCKIGAGAVVHDDVAAGETVYGPKDRSTPRPRL